MRRTAALAVVASLFLAACGDPVTSASVTASPLSTEGSSSTPSSSTPSSSTPSSSATSTVTEARAVAPDFALGLGDGGTFILSEEARPVYLVFWAEW